MLKSVILCSKCAKFPTLRRNRPEPLLDLASLTTVRRPSADAWKLTNVM